MADFHVAANPFGMMINPEAVIEAMNRSDRLERLQRRVYRPLDRPMLPKSGDALSMADSMSDDRDSLDADVDGHEGGLQAATSGARDGMSDVIAVTSRVLAY